MTIHNSTEASLAMGSEIKARIAAEITHAMKSGEKVRLGTLRMLSTAVRYREDALGRELTDDEVTQVAIKESKRRTEAVEAYEQAGREDLAEKERAERDVLADYVPQGLSDDEVAALVDEAVAATGAATMADMGKVMGMVMAGRGPRGRREGPGVGAGAPRRLTERTALREIPIAAVRRSCWTKRHGGAWSSAARAR
jgi:uncharacterized protein YqeY